jgi:hypothetical protein
MIKIINKRVVLEFANPNYGNLSKEITMIFNDNIARPYIYLITYNDTGEYYFGYREANKVPARLDIGTKYFTSSDKIKTRGLENTTIEIINEFEGSNAGNDAFDSEQWLIWMFIEDHLCLNACVRPPNGEVRWKDDGSLKKGKTWDEIYGKDKANEIRKKWKKSRIGITNSDESNEKRRLALVGIPKPDNSKPGKLNPFFGHHHSDEQIQRWKNNMKGKNAGSKNPAAKVNESQVKEIKILLKENKLKKTEIAKLYNVSKCLIGDISKNRTWTHVII